MSPYPGGDQNFRDSSGNYLFTYHPSQAAQPCCTNKWYLPRHLSPFTFSPGFSESKVCSLMLGDCTALSVLPQIGQAHNPGSLLSSKMMIPFLFWFGFFLKREGNFQWKAPDWLRSVKFTVALEFGHCILLFPEQTHFALSCQLRRGARALGRHIHIFSYLTAGAGAASTPMQRAHCSHLWHPLWVKFSTTELQPEDHVHLA